MSAALQLDELVYDSLESLSLPDVYIRLREVMESDNAAMSDAAEVISLDPALAARVLRMANSAFYGFRSQVDTITRAANILGMQKIHDLVLAASVSKAFEGISNELMDMDTFWYRSVHAGFLARAIAEGAGMRNYESLFVRGLLHDIGHLILFSRFPKECRQALKHCEEGLDARLYAEHELIGVDAMQFAAELARVWQLPTSISDSFAHLMRPEDVAGPLAREVAMLHIAVQFSSGIDTDLLIEDIVQRVRAPVWRIAELPPEVGAAALDATAMEMVDAMYNVIAQHDGMMM
ncbi:MAG: HDOD domain-containing protein [Gammaproteobacteria bacterium]|nr:HDOD domain-containing protein [Gammaproteobacteria bacterium]MCB1922410.1 HDOD domain-containing protein [Gammaproteobacteria bacterium]